MEEVKFTCPICNNIDYDYKPIYPGILCHDCDPLAVDEYGQAPWNDSWADRGSNPVFVSGVECWRRYKFGGWKTLLRTEWEAMGSNVEKI